MFKDAVVKIDDPARMRVEVEKSRRAFQIGKDCGLFCVPRVLDFDESKGVAVFERIYDVKPICKHIWGRNVCSGLAEALGISIACIHQQLTLPSDMIEPLPSAFALSSGEVFLHGDLSSFNICLGKAPSSIVILDWQMTSVHGGRATYGTRYFDLLWFINNLLYRPTFRFIFQNPVIPVAQQFLRAYFKEMSVLCDVNELILYAKHFFEVKSILRRRRSLSWKSRILLTCSDALTEEFIKSLQSFDGKNCE